MATIRQVISGKEIKLYSNHIFGRSTNKADTVLNYKDVSLIHASLRWDGTQWVLIDHSTNGTWINNLRTKKSEIHPLQIGNKIRFGNSHASIWELIELSPPTTMLTPLNEESASIEVNNIYAIPSEEKPEITLYQSDHGNWVSEEKGWITNLNDGDIIQNGHQRWRFHIATQIEFTQSQSVPCQQPPEETRFIFKVSLDEEHVFIQFIYSDNPIDLGERAHHYLLLILARQRLDDAQRGIESSSQGWIDINQLCDMLRMSETHINIHIFRARKKMSELAFITKVPFPIIERRLGSIRFPYTNIEIFKGDTKERRDTAIQ